MSAPIVNRGRRILSLLCWTFLLGAAYGQNLTVAVLVNSQNTSGYNTNPATPGEFQRCAERYLQHLQVPYQLFDVSAVSPPADLNSRQLIVAGHSRLSLPPAWQSAISSAVTAGSGFVNLDSDIAIGTQTHMASIFGATGSAAGTAASQITVPTAVAPGGAAPHFIAAMQIKFDGGGLVYPYHTDAGGVLRTSTSTVLQNAHGTVIASLGTDPLILATTAGSGRAVHFGTLDYLHADRFGFAMGLDDLFWRSLVWAARKPFVLRGYPRLWAVQMDDTLAGWGSRVEDLYDPNLTGQASVDGTGGPWRVTGYVYTDNLASGSADRAAAIADIKAGKLKISPHSFGDVNCGNMYWNACTGPLTDAQWQSNITAIDTWKQGAGGNDVVPSLSRSLVAHFWDLSDNTGFDLWNHFGFRYITSIQKSGFQSTLVNNGAERLPVLPFWRYEMPPKVVANPNFPTETYPFFFADDYTVNSRAGLAPQTFSLFATQYFDTTKYSRPDFEWPGASATPIPTVASSVAQLQQYTWRHWSSMSPLQLFTHDSLNYAQASILNRQAMISQASAWLTANGVRHVFMEQLGDYVHARRKSTLTGAAFDGTQLTYTFTGNAADPDGNLVATQVLLFQGDNEGAWQAVPGFVGGTQVTRLLPPAIQSVNPTSGLTTGGTTVTITGSGFTADSVVFFGQNTAASVSVLSSTTLQVTTPAGLPLTVDVEVSNSSGKTTLTGGFTYVTPPRVLVAAYGFNEGAGTTVGDISGNGNTGTIANATWSATGKFGKALSFNGTNAWVTINDSASLHLTNGMTIEAWVNPTNGTGWRNVMLKEQTGGMIYAIYANTDTNQPSGHVFLASEVSTRGTSAVPLNAWTHLAVTYNGVILRLYVNGVEVSNKSVTGNILVSNGVLHIGGDATWGEFFAGLIDEVRIYNQPSSTAEIQSDMAAAIGDTTPPTVSMTAPADGATVTGGVTVSANAADNVAVAGVEFLLDGASLGAEVTATPYSLLWNSSAAVNGAHTLSARARDGAGNQTTSAVVHVTTSNAAPDTTTPTVSISAPANGATVSGTVTVSANAGDNVAVAGVQFLLDGAALGGEDTVAPYSVSWNSAAAFNGPHTLAARARDSAGNVTTSATVTVTVTGGLSGLVAAYGFNEGAGTTTADASGNGNTATIANATWSAAGKFGKALSFNGTNAMLTVADSASLDLTSGMTVEAWVNPAALGAVWRCVVLKEQTAGLIYALYAQTDTNQPSGHVFVASEFNTRGTAAVALNVWTHLAATYDGATLSMYVNGVLAGSKAVGGAIKTSTGALRIGADSIWGEFFSGLIDEVRIYNRALSAAEIQIDMNTAVGVNDTTPPTVSMTAPANGATVTGAITVSANASDNIAVASVQFLLDGAALGNPVTAAPYAISWNSATSANGPHTLAARALDTAGNPATSAAVNVITSNAAPDTTPPTVSMTAPASGATVSGTVTVSANASDNVGVAGVQFLLDGASLGAEVTAAPYSVSWNSATAINGTHTLAARARDAAGNATTSSSVSVTVTGGISGLVAAYGFNEGAGTTTADSSGHANTGTLANATWSAAGKFGKALSFNGTNAWVTVADSASLDLTSGMTLEAWVNPAALGAVWRSVLLKEQTAGLIYALYAQTDTNRPSGHVFIASEFDTRGTALLPLNAWTHLAATYDGATLRMYVNGVLATSKPVSGAIKTSTGVLRMGGDSIWGEFFSGLIDEVRIYNRALSATEIQTDMNTPVQ